MVGCLEDENERLRQEVEMLHCKLSELGREDGEKIKVLKDKILELSRMKDVQEVSKSQRLKGKFNVKKNGNVLEKFDYLEQSKGKEKAVEL